jgi:tetratricopeptide (TPR) repeat protein
MLSSYRTLIPVLLAAALLNACATSGTGPAKTPTEAEEAAARGPLVVSDSAQEQAMYNVLVGELSSQRGRLDESAEHYLHAASLTRDPRIAERAVQIALASGNTEAGLQGARLLAELRPGDFEAQQLMVLVMLRGGRQEQALAPLERIVINTPGGLAQGALVATALLSQEQDKAVAVALMARLAERWPKLPEAHFGMAGLALNAGDPVTALGAVDRALALRPAWSRAMILRSRALLRQGKRAAAGAYLRRMVARYPKDSALRLHYARLLLDGEDYAAALAQFEAMQRLEPENPELILTLGVLYLQEQLPAKSKSQFAKLLRIGKQEATANYYLGRIAETEKHLPLAIRYYRAVDEGENAFDAQVRIAALLAEQGKLDAAMRHLEGIEAPDKHNRARLYLVQGELLRDHGRASQALALYTRALRELPDDLDLLYARAMVAERLGRLELLELDLRRIIAMDPDNAQALNALGYTLADRTERLDEALQYIDRALKLRPEDYYILDSMGWVQYRLGNYQAALSYLRRALAAKPDAEIAAHLGEVLWVMNRRDEARAVWDRGLKLNPSSKLIRESMQRLQGGAKAPANGG